MKKRKSAADLFKLPLPEDLKAKKKRTHVEKCEECKGPLSLNRKKGYGYCEVCHITTAIPVAVILSHGPHRGKYVYLEEGLRRELYEEYDQSDLDEEFEAELKDKSYFIIRMATED